MKKDHYPDLKNPGEYIIYGIWFKDFMEEIRVGMRDGYMEVSLDWNRSPWEKDEPMGSIIYRVKVLSKKTGEVK